MGDYLMLANAPPPTALVPSMGDRLHPPRCVHALAFAWERGLDGAAGTIESPLLLAGEGKVEGRSRFSAAWN